jgi:hypothetical protein
MDDEIVDVASVEVKKEPPNCVKHPLHILPCPLCFKLETDNKRIAQERKEFRAKRHYEWSKSFYDMQNIKFQNKINKRYINGK